MYYWYGLVYICGNLIAPFKHIGSITWCSTTDNSPLSVINGICLSTTVGICTLDVELCNEKVVLDNVQVAQTIFSAFLHNSVEIEKEAYRAPRPRLEVNQQNIFWFHQLCSVHWMVPPCQIKALQRADILWGTCPTIVSSPCICLITATERRLCKLPTSRRQHNSPRTGFSYMALYTYMKTTNCRKYWKPKHWFVCVYTCS